MTCTVQLAPAARVAPQVVAPVAKLDAPEPVIWKPTLAIELPPVLVTVNVCGAPATPVGCAGKFKLVGLTLIAEGNWPMPLSGTETV